MNTRNDYTIAIQTIAIQNKKLYQISQTERDNLIYLYVRDRNVNLLKNENLQNVLIKFYRNKSNLTNIGVQLMNIIHHEILNNIGMDLDDELSNLREERTKYELYSLINDSKWHPENNDKFWRDSEDDNWQWQYENDLEQQYENEYQYCDIM